MSVVSLRAWGGAGAWRTRPASVRLMDQLLGWSVVIMCGMAFFLIAFPSYGEFKIGGSPNIAPSRLARLTLLALLTIVLLIKPFKLDLTKQNDRSTNVIYYLVAFFWLWTLILVLFNSLSIGYAFSKLKNEIIPVWLSFWMAVVLFKKYEHVLWLLRSLWMAMLVVLFVMLIEVILKRNIFDGLLQVENFSTGLAFSDQSRDGFYRAKGTFQHPLPLAHFLISFGLLLVSKGIFQKKIFSFRSVCWWSLGVVAIVSVYFTNTRSGLAVGLIFMVLLFSLRYVVWLRCLKSRLLSLLLGLQLLWLPFLMTFSLYFFTDLFLGQTVEQRSSTTNRLLALFNGFEGVIQSPFIGYGNGLGVVKGGVSWAGGYQYTIDNLFLLQALDHGLPAALTLFSIFAISAWRLLPHYREWHLCDELSVRIGVFFVLTSSIAMYSIYALTDFFEICFVLIGATLCLSTRFQKNSDIKE